METAKPATEAADEARRGGRPAAGTDPQKLGQIMEGAGRVFATMGFDAASMSDVAREANVSKATLYVYFQNKQQLFAAICAEKRDRSIGEMTALLDVTKPLEAALSTFLSEMVKRVTQPFVVSAHRIVISVAERMPEIGREFYEGGPHRLMLSLPAFISDHAEAGRLNVDDPQLAAAQLLELGHASAYRPRLYGVITRPVSDEGGAKETNSAIRVFLAAY